MFKQSKEAAVNCASAVILQIGSFTLTYENIVAEIHLSGGNFGLKNHSKEFSGKVLTPTYDALKNALFCCRKQTSLCFTCRQNMCKTLKVT